MPESWILGGFLVWVAFHAWKGFRQGVWLALLSILGLVLGYVACFLYADKVAMLLERFGFGGASLFVAYPAVFIVVSELTRYLPKVLLPGLRRRRSGEAAAGAAVGTASGAVSGLLLLWFVGVVHDALQGPPEEAAVAQEETLLEQAAGTLVAKGAALGMQAAGHEPHEAEALAVFMRRPGPILQDVQALVKSPELAEVLHSPYTQRMMAINDAASLQHSSQFQALMAQSSSQNMLIQLQLEGRSEAQSEYFIAEQMTFIWRRLQYLKHDERVKTLLADEGLKGALDKGQAAALMTEPAFHELVQIILEDKGDMSDFDFTQVLTASAEPVSTESLAEQAGLPQPMLKPYAPQTVYKWTDDEGRVRYTDLEAVPDDKLNTATAMER